MGIYNKKILSVMLLFGNLFYVGAANAVNWVMLQGVTEEPYPLVWGFLQPTYLETSGTTLSAGPFQGQQAVINVMPPDLSSSQVFQIYRARLGVRGALPANESISYFLLAEYGNNGITQPGGGAGRVTLTDATITLSQIKGARFRFGQMKVPMSEEVFQGVVGLNYVNFSNIAYQQLIERPFWTDGQASCVISNPPGPSSDNYLRFCDGDAQTQFRGATVAVRDVGVEVFDAFRKGAWEHTYAVLVGQGGANKDNWNDSLDSTFYWSSEKIFGGMKAFRKGLKLYAWYTAGKRTIYDSATLAAGGTSLTAAEQEYDRKLGGLGGTYFDGTYRFWAEYIKVDGMIFNGTTGGAVPGAVSNNGVAVSQYITEPDGKGDGGYLDFGYRIKPEIELDIRYDWYNRVTNLQSTDERQFETWTLGVQYFFNETMKAIVNYEIRDVEAPGYPASSPANMIANDTDNRISAQLFLLF